MFDVILCMFAAVGYLAVGFLLANGKLMVSISTGGDKEPEYLSTILLWPVYLVLSIWERFRKD
jgi:hypothetical protein